MLGLLNRVSESKNIQNIQAKCRRRVVLWKANHWRNGRVLDWVKTVEGFQNNVQAVGNERVINLGGKEVWRQ